jgi:hypothetical protein
MRLILWIRMEIAIPMSIGKWLAKLRKRAVGELL